MTERKYMLTRLAPGDYLLPSNNGERIFRIARYIDGPSLGLEDMPRDREFWGIWETDLLNGTYGLLDRKVIDTDWSKWEMYTGCFDTRREAIDAVLR